MVQEAKAFKTKNIRYTLVDVSKNKQALKIVKNMDVMVLQLF